MENVTEQMPLVGFHHFSSKDKTQIYYVVQVLHTENDLTRGTRKGTLINVFVDDETYRKVNQLDFASILTVEIHPNVNTGKINYKIII